MITAKLITEAYVFLRTNNHSIPDEVLDFMKDASLTALEKINKGNVNSEKDKCSDCGNLGWKDFGDNGQKVTCHCHL